MTLAGSAPGIRPEPRTEDLEATEIASVEAMEETPAAGQPRPGAEASLESGALVGRYVILSKLGAGAMGVVLAAYDPATNCTDCPSDWTCAEEICVPPVSECG